MDAEMDILWPYKKITIIPVEKGLPTLTLNPTIVVEMEIVSIPMSRIDLLIDRKHRK